MKRSEMLTIIEFELDHGDMTAESILSKLEEAGMLPPQQMLGTIPVVVEAQTRWVPCHEWEEE